MVWGLQGSTVIANLLIAPWWLQVAESYRTCATHVIKAHMYHWTVTVYTWMALLLNTFYILLYWSCLDLHFNFRWICYAKRTAADQCCADNPHHPFKARNSGVRLADFSTTRYRHTCISTQCNAYCWDWVQIITSPCTNVLSHNSAWVTFTRRV